MSYILQILWSQLTTASKTQTAPTQVQLLVVVAAASQQQVVGIDLKHPSLSQAPAQAERNVEYNYARASSLCCRQGVDPPVARTSCEAVRIFAQEQHPRLATKRFLFRGMELLDQMASFGCLRDVRSVGEACLEAATWEGEQTVALGE